MSHASPQIDLRTIRSHPDYWYPVAWSHELASGKVIGTRYAGIPIALARPQNGGHVFALEDRCVHRQVPLSQGILQGDAIRCCYHGWAYDRFGRCHNIPYLGNCHHHVRVFPCREQSGMIFIFPGDASKADTTPLSLELAQTANPAYKTRLFGTTVRCHYSFMHENLMDMNHQCMHFKQVGQMKPRFLGQKREPGVVEARYSFARVGGKQPLGEAIIFGERRDTSDRFQNRDIMTIRTEYPYQTLRIQTGDNCLVMDLWIAYVPQSADELTNRTFGLLSIKRPKIPFLLDLAWPILIAFTNRIFAEDCEIVELEQKAWRDLGGDHNVEIFPVINTLRDLLRECGIPPDHHYA